MQLSFIRVNCPSCGSDDVVYSCTPNCCFNHVCGSCLASFELFTTYTGDSITVDSPKPADRDTSAPTVPCARCESLDVYQLSDDGGPPANLVCADCQAKLELGVQSSE